MMQLDLQQTQELHDKIKDLPCVSQNPLVLKRGSDLIEITDAHNGYFVSVGTKVKVNIPSGMCHDFDVLVNSFSTDILDILSQPITISTLDFKGLFTTTEWGAVCRMAETDDVILSWLNKFDDPQYEAVEPTSPLVVGVMDYLVSVNVITEARKTEILAVEA